MLQMNTVHVEKHRKSSSWLGNSVRGFVVHEHVNIHILLSLLWDYVHSNVWKVSSVNRGECVSTGVLYRPTHLCVAHFQLHRKLLRQFFLWCGKVEGCLGWGEGVMVHVSGSRGLYGVSERGGGIWVQGSHSLGEKLLSSLAERALMLQNRVPDGRSWKRLWEGWVGSFMILLALLEHLVRKMSRMEGRGALMSFAAVFTVRWRVLRSVALQFPYQTVIQLVSTLLMVPL